MATAGDGAAQGETSWEDRIWSIGKQALMFFAFQYAVKQFMGGGQKAATPSPAPLAQDGSQPVQAIDYTRNPHTVYPMWPSNASVDVSMYVSSSRILPPLNKLPADSLVLQESGFRVDGTTKDNVRDISTSFSVPAAVQNNGTLWAHVFIGQAGAELDPASPNYDTSKAYRMFYPLTQYLSKRKVRKTRNLLSSQNLTEAEEAEVEETATVASYYHPNITLSFVNTGPMSQWNAMHPAIKQFYVLDPTNARDDTGRNGFHYPVVYFNTFWQLKTHMLELNSSMPIEKLDMNVHLSTLANWQFSVIATMDEGMKETARKAARGETTPGGGDGSEFELIKTTLLDTNPYLLGTTVVVTILHMIFEFLAFKSDVGHWRKKKDNVGVSVRTILSNVVMQTVIFLYLLDNNESTSWMILFGQGIGIAIEAWKVTKTVDVRVREPTEGSWFYGKVPYMVVFEDKHVLSETEEKTEEYDRIAFYWMGVGAVPLLAAYAVYSLVYDTHKSWYSFIITTLVGSVYAYGFLMMVPSLYINYRLQSVAHMPAKAMTYKFLNTFIDDLFAFTIKMPMLHRLATLRDDLIFFVYLYQGWKYKVDYTRVNEFGQGGDEEGVEEKKAVKPLQAPPEAKADAGDVGVDVGGKVGSSGADVGGGKKRKG